MKPTEQIFNALCAAHAYADNPQSSSALMKQLNMEPSVFAEAFEQLREHGFVTRFVNSDPLIWIVPTKTHLCNTTSED